jgi:hypothetical protein
MKRKYLINFIVAAMAVLTVTTAVLFSCTKENEGFDRQKPPTQLIKPPDAKPPAISLYQLAELYERGEDWVAKQFGREYLRTPGINWTTDDHNYVLENQARVSVMDIQQDMLKPYAEITTEYFEKNREQCSQIALDIRVASSDTIGFYEFAALPYALDDLAQDQILYNVKVGDLVLMNVRTLVPFAPQEPIGGYFTATGVTYGIFVIPGQHNPDYWAKIVAKISNPGYVNIGTQLTGLKKSILLIASE